MNQLKIIQLYPAKRVKPQPTDSVKVIANGGLDGDLHCHDSQKQISITDQVVLDWMASQKEPGLCFQKFSANLVIDELDYDQMYPGTQIRIDDAQLEVQHVGKHCFGDECIYCRQGIDCILIKGILFCCGKTEGCIHVGTRIEVNQ